MSKVAVADGGRHDGGLVGTGKQQFPNVLDRPNPAAHRHRHEAALGRATHHVEDGAAVLMAGGDVQEAEFVGAGRIISGGGLDRIAGIDEIDEIDPLDHPAVLDVETGDDARFQHWGHHD